MLEHHIDLSVYDIFATGNLILRNWLAEDMQHWGLHVTAEQVYLGLGAMDSLNKVLCGLSQMYREQGDTDYAILFPEPGFGTPEWQARTYNYRFQRFQTCPENGFKLTATQLDELLTEDPHIRVIYLTVTNNPTTFAYSPDELRALHAVVATQRKAGMM